MSEAHLIKKPSRTQNPLAHAAGTGHYLLRHLVHHPNARGVVLFTNRVVIRTHYTIAHVENATAPLRAHEDDGEAL